LKVRSVDLGKAFIVLNQEMRYTNTWISGTSDLPNLS